MFSLTSVPVNMDADQKKLADYLSLVETETINSLGGISRGFLADEEFEEKFMRLAMSRYVVLLFHSLLQ